MSYLGTFFEYIQSLCVSDTEMSNAAKEIDELNHENAKIEKQSEDLDREHDRLQIELYNIESIVSFQNDKDAIVQFQQTSVKMYEFSIDLNNLLNKIDFTKILQCHHMKMETKCHQEWQPLQEGFVKTVKWQEQMEQRSIVQKYRQTEKAYRMAEESYQREKETKNESLRECMEQIKQATDKRNELIVNLIKGSKDLDNLREKLQKLKQYEDYIDELKQEKLALSKQLEQMQLETFNPHLNPNSTHKFCTNSSQNYESTNIITPQLPSFMEILKSFNQTEKKTNITTIENTTEICIKSILHNSSNNQSITTKKTKNVRFKVQLEEYEEDITQTIYSEEIESETDVEIEVVPQQIAMETNESYEEKENLQEMKDLTNKMEIETIDLLTPAENLSENMKDIEEHMDSIDNITNTKNEINKKSPIEIQECIVFKTPFPIQEVCSTVPERESDLNSLASCSKNTINSLSPPSSNANIKELLNQTKKSFFEDFLNVSTNSELSPETTSSHQSKKHKTMMFNEFESFFENNKEFLFASKESDEGDNNIYNKSNLKVNNNPPIEVQDFLDFGSSRGFTFDSDDNMNMADKYKAGNMDFM